MRRQLRSSSCPILLFLLAISVLEFLWVNIGSKYLGGVPEGIYSTAYDDFEIRKFSKLRTLSPNVFTQSKVSGIKHNPEFSRQNIVLYWSQSNPRDVVCVIKNGCLQKNGVLLLEDDHRDMLDSVKMCHKGKISFASNLESIFAKSSYRNKDLYSAFPARWHIPHFLEDIMPYIFAFDILNKSNRYSEIKSKCLLKSAAMCATRPPAHNDPILLVEDRILSMTDGMWVPSFVKLLPGSPVPVFEKTLFEKDESQCFRSITAYNMRRFDKGTDVWYRERNSMFGHGKLNYTSVIDLHAKELRKGTSCRLKVLIISREGQHMRGDFPLGRNLINTEDLSYQLKNIMGDESSIQIDISIHQFEMIDFREQVIQMQNADIVVAAHGAGVSNMFFLRKDVPIIEIFPFSYYTGPFDSIAKALSLPYVATIAEPDTLTFFQCVETRARRKHNSTIYNLAHAFWDKAVNNKESRGAAKLFNAVSYTEGDESQIKVCSRCQQLFFNTTYVAVEIQKFAKGICYGHKSILNVHQSYRDL